MGWRYALMPNARAVLLCGSMLACSATTPPLPRPPVAKTSTSAQPESVSTSTSAPRTPPNPAEPDPARDSTPQTALTLAHDPGRDVVVRFDAAACTVDAGTSLTVEVVVDGQVRDNFVLSTLRAPAACDDHGRTVEKGDFNFDGHEDLAVPIDNSGPYGAPTYLILLFRPATLHYAEAPALSALTRENLGLFSVDAKRKRLITGSKSGCCIHYQSELAVSDDVPTLVSSKVESIVFGNDRCTVIVERTPEHGKPSTTRRPCSKGEMP